STVWRYKAWFPGRVAGNWGAGRFANVVSDSVGAEAGTCIVLRIASARLDCEGQCAIAIGGVVRMLARSSSLMSGTNVFQTVRARRVFSGPYWHSSIWKPWEP